jgi:hypothetical protein
MLGSSPLAPTNRLREVGPIEVGPREVGPIEVGPREVGPREVGPIEVGPREVGPSTMPLYQGTTIYHIPDIGSGHPDFLSILTQHVFREPSHNE